MKAETESNIEGDDQVPGSHAGYGDPLVESLGEILLPRLEGVVGEGLWPTYGYYRLYKTEDVLRPHIDRVACEVSLTICLGHNSPNGIDGKANWPIWFRPLGKDGKATADKSFGNSVDLRPGDAALYKGCELVHWREPFEGSWQAQVFLHYVRRSAPYSDFAKYDAREGLGRSLKSRNPVAVEKMQRVDRFQWLVLDKRSKD